jgi:hypothetical protein
MALGGKVWKFHHKVRKRTRNQFSSTMSVVKFVQHRAKPTLPQSAPLPNTKYTTKQGKEQEGKASLRDYNLEIPWAEVP